MHANARRAITLAGGGPEAALHIGALAFFEQEAKIRFDIWALSCIGAWVGIYYQQCEEGKQAEQTKSFFRKRIYRDNISYDRFPINAVFGPDLGALGRATIEFKRPYSRGSEISNTEKCVQYCVAQLNVTLLLHMYCGAAHENIADTCQSA